MAHTTYEHYININIVSINKLHKSHTQVLI